MTTTRLLANKIFIDWNPVTDGGRVVFHINPFVVDENNSPTSYTDPSAQQIRTEQVEKLATRVIDEGQVDPVTQQTLPSVSGAGVMVLIKRLTEQLLEEMQQVDEEELEDAE